MPTSAKLVPQRFLRAAKVIDANRTTDKYERRDNYCCPELHRQSGIADGAEERLFHALFRSHPSTYGLGYVSDRVHPDGTVEPGYISATFNGAHSFDYVAADKHRVIALLFAYQVAKDIAAGKEVL